MNRIQLRPKRVIQEKRHESDSKEVRQRQKKSIQIYRLKPHFFRQKQSEAHHPIQIHDQQTISKYRKAQTRTGLAWIRSILYLQLGLNPQEQRVQITYRQSHFPRQDIRMKIRPLVASPADHYQIIALAKSRNRRC